MPDRRHLTRRAALGLIGAGGLLSVAHTYSRTSSSAQRGAELDVVDDPSAYLGISGRGQDPKDEVTVTNNTTSFDLEVTVATSNFTIDTNGGATTWTFQLVPTESRDVEFFPEDGNEDDVQFTADLLDGSGDPGTIDLQRTITIPAEPGTTEYRIENVHSGLVMSPTFVWSNWYYSVEQDTWNDAADQRWTIIDNGDGTHRIQNVDRGTVLGIRNSSTADEASVILRNWNGADDRRWAMDLNDDGSYRLINENSNKAADVYQEGTSPEVDIVQWPWKGDEAVPNQKWIFKPV